jgi:hypothetical protein
MSRFYKHNIDDSRNRHVEIHKVALKSGPVYSNAWYAECSILQLEHVAINGLPDCYESFIDFLCYYPSLSWKPEERNRQIRLILDDSRLPSIVERIKADWDFDLQAEFEAKATELMALCCHAITK